MGSAHVPAPAEHEMVSIGKRLMETAAEQIGGDMILNADGDGYELRLEFDHPPDVVEEPIRAAAP